MIDDIRKDREEGALVDRLQFCAALHPKVGYPENGKLFLEAADRITELEAQLDEARNDALEEAAIALRDWSLDSTTIETAEDVVRALKTGGGDDEHTPDRR